MLVIRPFALSTMALAIAMALTGCGDKEENKAEAATQVVAKVNGDEITVHQLNFEVSKLGNLNPDQAKKATEQVLKSLVDQQLLIQKGSQDKVDREPRVLQSVEAAKHQILAQAVLQKATTNIAQPSSAELADYYAKNPYLFSERRIYRFQEINIKAEPEQIDLVKEQLQQAKNLGDFFNWLKAQNIPAHTGQSTKSAEQLPLELLPRLHQLKDGQAITLTQPAGLNVLVLAGSASQPLTQEQAKPMIERYLVNNRKREAGEAMLDALREKATIEYRGEYARMDKPLPAEPATPRQPVTAVDTNTKAIEQGMSGLK